MKKLLALPVVSLGAALALATAVLSADEDKPNSLDAPFVDGGRITLELSAGEHRIIGVDGDHIRVRWRADDRRRGEDVETKTDIDGNMAKIELDGPRKNFRTVIEVPRHSDLKIRLSAGELAVEKVTGGKDIRLNAGDLSIEVGDGGEYALVEGSVWAGDIDARTLGTEASGLFRSIDWVGEGKHELSFHLYAGDVTLY